MKKQIKLTETVWVYFFLFILNPFSGISQSTSTISLNTILAPDLRYGRLPNGLTYYIKSVEENQPKLDLRLLVKVGQNMETKNQLEIAHIIEHLAFEGSTNFPSGLRNDERLFKKFGMSMSDVTAYIGTLSTQYIFKAPENKPEALDAVFLWFKDIATGLNFSVKDIKDETGIVRQEFIMRAGGNNLIKYYARSKLLSELFPCRSNRSDFLAQKQTFTADEVRKFHKTWYRPDLMAISIVGNIDDLDKMENRIKNRFSDIPLPPMPAINLECDSLYIARKPQFVIVEKKSDSLNTLPDETVNFHLFYRNEEIDNINTLEELKKAAAVNILNKILYRRFQEIENTYNSPYEIKVQFDNLSLPASFMELTISARNSSEKTALKKSVEILNQISSEGVLKEEWNTAKNIFLKNLETRNTETVQHWVQQIRNHYVFGKQINLKEKVILKKWFSNISFSEFNELIKDFISPMPEDISIIAPMGNKALSYSEEEMRSLIRDSFNKKTEPYKLPQIRTSLMTKEEIKKLKVKPYITQRIGNSGALEMELANGVKLILKSYLPSTGMYDNEIMLHGFRNMGASVLGNAKQASALNAPRFIRHAGAGDMNFFELKRYLATSSIKQGVFPYINYKETGIRGSAELQDFERMLQLVYLYFTKPRKDKTAFKDWKEYEREIYLNPTYSLNTVDYNNSIRLALGDSMVTPEATKRFESIRKTDFESGSEYYRKFFGSARDFTFIISGKFPLEPVLPLARKYLGNLSNSEKIIPSENLALTKVNSALKDSIIKIPISKYYPTKNIGYAVRFIKKAEHKNEWQEQILVEALGLVANYFSGNLRFKNGFSIYDWGASGKFNADLMQYEIGFTVNCTLEEFYQIRKEFKNIISEIKSGNIPEEHFKQSLQRMYLLYNTEERGNVQRTIKSQLYEHYRYDIPWVDPQIKEKFVKSIILKDIVETANKYFNEEYLYEFVRGKIK